MHPPTQILTVLGLIKPYEILDDPLLEFSISINTAIVYDMDVDSHTLFCLLLLMAPLFVMSIQ